MAILDRSSYDKEISLQHDIADALLETARVVAEDGQSPAHGYGGTSTYWTSAETMASLILLCCTVRVDLLLLIDRLLGCIVAGPLFLQGPFCHPIIPRC